MMITMKITTIICMPMAAVSDSWYIAHMTPPRPASAEPATNTATKRRRMR